jgi:hypothetical protein
MSERALRGKDTLFTRWGRAILVQRPGRDRGWVQIGEGTYKLSRVLKSRRHGTLAVTELMSRVNAFDALGRGEGEKIEHVALCLDKQATVGRDN